MSVATKNLFDVLGNSLEDDTPAAPVKVVEKTSTHTAKRNTDGLAPSKGPVTTGRRAANVTGNEAAFRDRNAGRESNRGKSTEEGPRGPRRGGYRGRGGRREEGDRHPHKAPITSNSEKQAAQSWGANEGNAELKDSQAAEAIAESEKKEAAEGEAAPEAKEEEPEEKHISYQQYLAELAEKKLALEAEAALKIRKPNEGVKEDKWKGFAPLVKDDQEELFSATTGKPKRERERKVKQFVEIENRYIEERPRGGRGGRGGSRGEGGRGRGRGAPRGEFRGGRGRGGQENQPINTQDESAFPSLGGN
ncbi:hypothetical protein VTK26DRAFT_9103 [Humicola hyalothermophila]